MTFYGWKDKDLGAGIQLNSEAFARNRAFWAEHLAGYAAPPQLQPPEGTDPAARAEIQFRLDVDGLTKAAANSGATLFMVLAAAYAGAILQSLQLSDIVIITTASLRRFPGLQDCVGCLLDIPPLRIRKPKASSDQPSLLEQVPPQGSQLTPAKHPLSFSESMLPCSSRIISHDETLPMHCSSMSSTSAFI